MLSLRVTSQKWTLFCVHYYSKLLMRIYINYIPLEAWVHCLQTATVNWCWDNISTEIFKKKTDFFQYLAHPPLWKKQESGKTWRHGFSFTCGCIRKQRRFKPPAASFSEVAALPSCFLILLMIGPEWRELYDTYLVTPSVVCRKKPFVRIFVIGCVEKNGGFLETVKTLSWLKIFD